MKDKFILNDGTTIELEPGASLAGLTTVFTDWTEVAAVMPMLTEENLAGAKVQSEEGRVWTEFADVVLQPGAWEVKEDGVHITISLREKTDMEKRMDDMESGQEIQNEAITELAGMMGGE